jgi:short subunit dehydrogenase-like uncharacterized protein
VRAGDPAVLIYGANGYTGQLIARAGAAGGRRPILAGRRAAEVARLAGELGLPHRVAPLPSGSDPGAALDPLLEGVTVVVNAAGPYQATAPALVEACLRQGCHYLDLSGEVASIEAMAAHHARARQRGVMIMPSVGFEVVASNCLTVHLWRALPGACRLALAISGLDLISRGSARTVLQQVGRPAQLRTGGRLVEIPAGSRRRHFDFGPGPRAAVAVGWVDLASAYYATGIPDIEVFYDETTVMQWMQLANQLWGWTRQLAGVERWLELGADLLPAGPTEAQRQGRRAVVVGEVSDGRVSCRQARLSTPEAYTFSTGSTWAIVDRVLAGDLEPGFQTPGGLYGPELVMGLPGVIREDLPRFDAGAGAGAFR